MPELTAIEAAINARAWYPLAAAILAFCIGLYRKLQPVVWDRIPTKWQWLPVALLSSATGFVDVEMHGQTLLHAVLGAVNGFLLIGLPAIGMAHTFKRVVASTKPVVPPAVVALVLFLMPGCSVFKSPRSVSDAAHNLCELVLAERPEVIAQAKQKGISAEEVAKALCQINDIVRPFLAGASDAGDAAVGKAKAAGLLR